MNLTLKRMVKFTAVCMGVCAFATVTMAAAPTHWWVADSFETADGGSDELPIDAFKCTTYEVSADTFTNYLWVTDENDASKIVATNSTYTGTRPGTNAEPAQLVLKLETEGNTLTRHVLADTGSTGVSFSAGSVYVDTLIKFTPSEDTPTIGSEVKVAVYLNVESNLVVYHGVEGGVTHSVMTSLGVIDTETWHRLTIVMDNNIGLAGCQLFLDGSVVTNDSMELNGKYYYLLAQNDLVLNAVAFQGTGFVDDLAVADGADLSGASAIMLTLIFDSHLTVTQNSVALNSGDEVESDSAIEVTAAQWYEIASLGDLFTGGATTNVVDGTTMITNIMGSVSGDAGTTNEITSQLYSETMGISTGLGDASYPADKVAAWANAHGVTTLTPSMLDEYLLKITPDEGDTTIEITSIVVGATEATITLAASSTEVDFEDLNGTLNIYTTSDLGTTFEPAGSFDVDVTAGENGTATITVPLTDGDFIKATVE